MPNEQFFSYMYFMARVSYIRWDDNDVRFVLDQRDKLDFYSESSPNQLSEGRHVSPLIEHIILIPIQQVFPLSP